MRGRLDADESLRMLLHLVPGCPDCQKITSELWWAADGRGARAGTAIDYGTSVDLVFDRVRRIQAELEAERAAARQVLAGLSGLAMADWKSRLAGAARTWGLCELLLERSREARAQEEPRDAEALAGSAVAVAGEIPAGIHPAGLVEDLTARAWLAVAEARRSLAELAGAEEALRQAEAHLARGLGERLARARLCSIRAALRTDQERFREADRLLRRALAVYRRLGQVDLLGRTFVQQGYVRACAGDLPGAAVALRQGLALADAARDPETACAALYTLAVLTCQSPATISANPSPSIQPNRSPRKPTASSTATSGWSVP
jgi:tetratricopeptide (TPR) repeat protein